MMYTATHDDKQAHFLAMPRTASKACAEAFKGLGNVTFDGHHSIKHFDELVKPGDLVMSTVRNPWDWFTSFWHLQGCPGRFDRFISKLCRESEWIDRNPTCTECRLFRKYATISSVILRYESVESDMNAALTSHGFPTVTLKQNGEKKSRPYQTYYKSQSREYVRRVFKDEIAQYGYKF